MKVRLIVVSICLIFLSQEALAWWEVGHMMVAQVAKFQLQKDNADVLAWAEGLVQDLNSLTDGRSNNFVEASCWADDIKEPGTDYLNNWHFTNHPINSNGYFNDRYPSLLIVIDSADIQSTSIDAMRRAKSILTNKKNINFEHSWAKAQIIRYIIHVIGDMSQPLHNSNFYNGTYSKGDKGGNEINIKKLDGTNVNLHFYLDAGAFLIQPSDEYLERPLNKSATIFLEKLIADKMLKYPKSSFADKNLEYHIKNYQSDPQIWTEEGYQDAINSIYPFLKNNYQITEDFQNEVYKLCERNIVLGGYRLASYLTSIFDNIEIAKEQISFVEGKLNQLIFDKKDRLQALVKD